MDLVGTRRSETDRSTSPIAEAIGDRIYLSVFLFLTISADWCVTARIRIYLFFQKVITEPNTPYRARNRVS